MTTERSAATRPKDRAESHERSAAHSGCVPIRKEDTKVGRNSEDKMDDEEGNNEKDNEKDTKDAEDAEANTTNRTRRARRPKRPTRRSTTASKDTPAPVRACRSGLWSARPSGASALPSAPCS